MLQEEVVLQATLAVALDLFVPCCAMCSTTEKVDRDDDEEGAGVTEWRDEE